MPKLVLIVDDDPAQRRILEETIKRLGYETRTAQGGEQALQILEGPDRGAIALVLLDHVMPGIDGMEVLKRLAPKEGTPPIIMQTAHGSIDAAITAMRAGAADFVVKPTSPERLEVSINSALKIEALQGEIARIKKKAEGTLTFGDLIVRGLVRTVGFHIQRTRRSGPCTTRLSGWTSACRSSPRSSATRTSTRAA